MWHTLLKIAGAIAILLILVRSPAILHDAFNLLHDTADSI